MSGPFSSLLALDALFARPGCRDGLNPALKAAMQADQNWPSRSAGPDRQDGPLPENAVPFPATSSDKKQTA